MAEPVSVLVHTRNSIAGFDAMLASVEWAREIIVVDMQSTDGTRERAVAAGARVFDAPIVPRIDGIRSRYVDEALCDWVFAIDSDEYLGTDAKRRIEDLIGAYGARYDVFAVPRHNYFGGRRLAGSGWYPDHQLRLFRKGTLHWSDTTHQWPQVAGGAERIMKLEPPDCLHIHHNGYADIPGFIRKQLDYAVNDVYADDPDAFSLDAYVSEAWLEFRHRSDPQADGDLSNALATVMAWDRIMRAVIHWERLGRRPEFGDMYALPVVLEVERSGVAALLRRAARAVRKRLR
jgi:glycosyltransferase involved in cell wall biosynthesis